MRSVHSGRLERWLGAEKLNEISRRMRGWYGPPIHLLDVPGSVRVCGDGDFIGPFERGYFASAADALREHIRRLAQSRATYGQFGLGFAGVQDYIDRVKNGYAQRLKFAKTATSITSAGWSLWASSNGTPAAGAAGSAAPGGRVPTSTTTGAIPFNDPSSGTLHLTGANYIVGNANPTTYQSVLLYDRIFDVAKTMSSSATEAVTGVPTRYQSTTATDADYAGGNFVFPEVGTALSNTAHNWTVCQYTDQAGNTGQSIPSVAGIQQAAAQRIDLPTTHWFMPLADNDVGIKNLTQMQCSSAALSGAVNFVMGHPIGFLSAPMASLLQPFDWITSKEQAPRVFAGACLAILFPTAQSNNVIFADIELTNAP